MIYRIISLVKSHSATSRQVLQSFQLIIFLLLLIGCAGMSLLSGNAINSQLYSAATIFLVLSFIRHNEINNNH